MSRPNSLTRDDYVWAVSIVDMNDGKTGYHSYWKDYTKAHNIANSVDGKVVQTTLWKGDDGLYYSLPYLTEILIDPPNRKSILNKLSRAERKVLGLEK